MKQLPILFSTPMVSALLDGRKTQTRRLAWRDCSKCPGVPSCKLCGGKGVCETAWQRVQPGDLLWVRENWRVGASNDSKKPRDLPARTMTVLFAAGGCVSNVDYRGDWRSSDEPKQGDVPGWAGKLRPGIFQPRWASRLTLEVTAAKIERLHDISDDDARAEGIYVFHDESPAEAYRQLWISLHGKESWDANPEVVALTFTVKLDMDKAE